VGFSMSTATGVLPLTRLFFSVRELAEITNLCLPTVYRLCRDGEIDSVRFGDSIRIPRRELARLTGEQIFKV